jgi:hypothetical protein
MHFRHDILVVGIAIAILVEMNLRKIIPADEMSGYPFKELRNRHMFLRCTCLGPHVSNFIIVSMGILHVLRDFIDLVNFKPSYSDPLPLSLALLNPLPKPLEARFSTHFVRDLPSPVSASNPESLCSIPALFVDFSFDPSHDGYFAL